jgi:DNA-binding response OmpR family regulator
MTVRNTLIVEDNPNIAGLLSLHLGDMGYSVRVSGDGISGLSLAR